MIKQISSLDPFIQVDGGMPAVPYINTYNISSDTASFIGQVRWNSTNSCIEIFNGSSWSPYPSNHVSLKLTERATSAIAWAEMKMFEEQQLKERMEKHPGLRDAYEKFKIMDILCSEDEESSP